MQDRIVFDHVWKKFRLGERHTSLRDLLPSLAKRAIGRGKPAGALSSEEFWAVQDVAFTVQAGEALGIIGPNGAGKSTALKLLTRILRANRGTCAVHGRVGALIEIAAGFHPDLTGRENIFLQGAIMGMRRVEISAKLDEIIEFAGVSGFIDTQVKRYSSGMNARLGFAIAAHLDPDVLIIDEVLSVGDMAFQERCVRRMERFKRAGVAIVFVSHNLQAVANLCDRALFLQRETRYLGGVDDAIKSYIEFSAAAEPTRSHETVTVSGAELRDAEGDVATVVAPGQPLRLRARISIREQLDDLTFGFILYRSTDQLIVYEGNVPDHRVGFDRTPTESVIEFAFNANLTRGQYHVELYVLHNPTHEYLCRLVPAVLFSVHEEVTCRGVADLQLVATGQGPADDVSVGSDVALRIGHMASPRFADIAEKSGG
jgi:lipopolysaccharide transport system ATP-binding protein